MEKTFKDYLEEAKGNIYEAFASRLSVDHSNAKILMVGCSTEEMILPFLKGEFHVTPIVRDEEDFANLSQLIDKNRVWSRILTLGRFLPVDYSKYENKLKYEAVIDSGCLNVYNNSEELEILIKKMQDQTTKGGYLLTGSYNHPGKHRLPTLDESEWEEIEQHSVRDMQKFLLARKKRIVNSKKDEN